MHDLGKLRVELDHLARQGEHDARLLPAHGTGDYLTVLPGFRPDQVGEQDACNQAGLAVLAGDAQVSRACACRVIIDTKKKLALEVSELDRLADELAFWHAAVRLDEATDLFPACHGLPQCIGLAIRPSSADASAYPAACWWVSFCLTCSRDLPCVASAWIWRCALKRRMRLARVSANFSSSLESFASPSSSSGTEVMDSSSRRSS